MGFSSNYIEKIGKSATYIYTYKEIIKGKLN